MEERALTEYEEKLVQAAVVLNAERMWLEAAELAEDREAAEEARGEVARATVQFLAVRAEERL